MRKALRTPGAPGRASRSQLRPGFGSHRSGSRPRAPAASGPSGARHSPARDGPLPARPGILLPGKWREAARGPCPPRGGSPRVPGPAGLFAGAVMARRRRVATRGDRRGRTRSGELGSWRLSEKERAARAGGACGGRELGGGGRGRLRPGRVAAARSLPSSRPRSAARGPGRVWSESRGSAQGLGI